MAGPDRILVIGAGLGGLRTIEHLRRLGYSGRLQLVGAEPIAPYDRPTLSKEFLTGQASEPPYLRPPDDYGSLGVQTNWGRRVVDLDTDRRVALLDDGEELGYDTAVLAPGVSPRVPASTSNMGLRTLRTHADAVRLRESMRTYGSVVVIGGGFIGCEVVSSARQLGIDATIVELLPGPLSRVLGDAVSAEVAALHRRAGVTLHVNTAVTEARVAPSGRNQLVLSDGSIVPGEVVLAAVGVTPNTTWLEASNIELGDGILCDRFGQTSTVGVWAVGDAAAWWDPLTTSHRRFEHWTSAGEQASAVATNILAEQPLATGSVVPYFWSDQHSVRIQSLGLPSAQDRVELTRVGPERRLLATYGRDGIVTAVVGFGLAQNVMRLRPLIASRGAYSKALALAAE